MGKGNLVNKPCPCGSGKKFKHCCMKKKPGNTSITMDTGKPVVVNEMKMSPDGTLEASDSGSPLTPEDAYSEVNYDRKNGPSILHKIPLDPNQLTTNPNLALRNFDWIFAIDTDTNAVNGEAISISCIVYCKLTKATGDETVAEYAPIHCLEFRNIKQNAENIAWMKSIQLITANSAYSSKLKIAVIVDSDLENLPVYNKRTAPIYGDFYLPENFTLIYASTDTGNEFVANKLISKCHTDADKLFKDISLNKVSNKNLREVVNEPYSHFRLWNKK